jgi:hypothetical protein
MVIKSLRGKGKSIEINRLNKITALFMLVTTWIVATLNPSIRDDRNPWRPDYRDDFVPDADVRDPESPGDAQIQRPRQQRLRGDYGPDCYLRDFLLSV